jgi:hypothetical protein
MKLPDKYLSYIRNVRRYSARTADLYDDVLRMYCVVIHGKEDVADDELVASMNVSEIRSYEVRLLEK